MADRLAQLEGRVAWASKDLKHLQTFVIGDDTKLDRPLLESF